MLRNESAAGPALARLEVLGPLRAVDHAGAELPVRGAQQRGLLALLAVFAPHEVTIERLLLELWPASDGSHALHTRVYQLRRLLGSESIERTPTGYRLSAGVALDLDEWHSGLAAGRSLAERGDHAGAVVALRRAIEVWRGEPLGDVDVEPVRNAGASWSDELLAGHELLASSELRVGEHDRVVERLSRLVAEHPLREGLHARLVLALDAQGRQTEALRAFERARRYLIDEVGVSPGLELAEAERLVLDGVSPFGNGGLAGLVGAGAATAIALPPLPALVRTSFVSRHIDVELLEEQLRHQRLVSIVGPGGVGKTRLANELAHRMEAVQPVAWVSLAAVGSSDALCQAIADGLGGSGAVVANLDALAAEIGDRTLLLVLDNCEHLTGSVAPIVDGLLGRVAGLRILTTTREPLGVTGEQLWPLTPLDLPSGAGVAAVAASPAAVLFVDRGRLVRPGLQIDATTAAHIAAICERLDGLPLALELAAARLLSISLVDLRRQVDEHLQVVRATRGPADTRHATLDSLTEWSYELLPEQLAAAFCRLAVFAGPFTEADAVVVLGEHARAAPAELADRSLLETTADGPVTSYRMLATIRSVATARLAARGDAAETRLAHARWVAQLAAELGVALRSSGQLDALNELDRRHRDIAAAIEWALRHDVRLAQRIAARIAYPAWLRGRASLARTWLAAAIEAAPDTGAVGAATWAWSGFLATMGGWGHDPTIVRGTIELGIEHGRQALAALDRDDTPIALRGVVAQLLAVSLTRRMVFLGHVPDAELDELLARAEADARAADDPWTLTMCLATRAIAAIARGALADAARWTDAAAGVAGELDERYLQNRIAFLRGLLAEADGDLPAAARQYRRARQLAIEMGAHESVAAHERQLAAVLDRLGEPAPPPAHSSALRATDDLATAASLQIHLAWTETDNATAAGHAGRALAWYRDLGLVHGEVLALITSALIDVEIGRHAAARADVELAVAIAASSRDPDLVEVAGSASALLDAEIAGVPIDRPAVGHARPVGPHPTVEVLRDHLYACRNGCPPPWAPASRARPMPTIVVLADRVPGLAAHQAVDDSLARAAAALGRDIAVEWVSTDAVDPEAEQPLGEVDGLWVAATSPARDVERARHAVRHAVAADIPTLATRGGLQIWLVEAARSEGFDDANQARFDPSTSRLFLRSTEPADTSFRIDEHAAAPLLERSGITVTRRGAGGEPNVLEDRRQTFLVATTFDPHLAAPASHNAHPLVEAFVAAAVARSEQPLAQRAAS